MWRWLVLGCVVAEAACGRVAFDPRNDGSADIDASGDAVDGGGPAVVAHWAFDDDPADGVLDSSGRNHPGLCMTTCPVQDTGAIAGAYHFNGASSAIAIADAPDLRPNTGISISFWLNLDFPADTAQGLVQKVFGTSLSDSWQVTSLAGGVLAMCVERDTGFGCTNTNSNTVVPTFWHHVVFTWDGAFARLYIDAGRYLEVPATILPHDTGSIMVGADRDNGSLVGFMAGKLDDVRVYDYALSPAEITDLATP